MPEYGHVGPFVNCDPVSAADVTVDVTGTLARTSCTPVVITGFSPTAFIRDTSIDDPGGNGVVTGVIFALIATTMSPSVFLGMCGLHLPCWQLQITASPKISPGQILFCPPLLRCIHFSQEVPHDHSPQICIWEPLPRAYHPRNVDLGCIALHVVDHHLLGW